MPQENEIYTFMKSNGLTQLDENAFLNKYSTPEKAKEIHSFMQQNDLTKLDESAFYDKYLKKKQSPQAIPVTGQRFALGGESTPQLPLTSQSKLVKEPKAVADFNTKYGTNYTLKQLAGKEPIPPKDETPFVMEKIEAVKRGSERLGQMIANTPSFIYDIAAYPQNKIAELTGLDIGTNAKEFAEKYNLPENEVANYYKQAAESSQKKISEKYDKGVTEYFFGAKPDYKKGFNLLTTQIAESLPITLSLMAGNAAGLSATASALGGGVVFGAGKKDQLEQTNPNMPQSTQVENALGNGLMEGFFEQYGLTKLGSLGAKLIKEKGKDEAAKLITEGFKETYLPILKKYLGIGAEESVGEAATQFAQNVIDKYSGEKPDLDLSEGVADAAMVGMGSSVGFTTPTATAEILSISKDRKKAKEVLAKKAKVEEQIANPNTTPEAKQALVEVAKDLTAESADIFDKAKTELQNIPQEEMGQLNEMSAKVEQLDNASQDATLDPELKRDLEIKHEEASKQLDDKIDELTEKYKETSETPKATTEENIIEPTPTESDRTNNANIELSDLEAYFNDNTRSTEDSKYNPDLSGEGELALREQEEQLLQLGADRIQAHGIAKGSIGQQFKDLLSILTKGLDKRGGGQLYTAPLVMPENMRAGAGAALGTGGGTAYIDGGFIILARAGVNEIKSINDIGGVLVNQSVADSLPELVGKLKQLFPNLSIDSYSNSTNVISEINAKAALEKSTPTEDNGVGNAGVEPVSVEEQKAVDEAILNLTEPLRKEIKGLTTIENLMSEGVLEYVDEKTGEPCMKHGGRGNSFKRGSKWSVVKDLKGYKTHEQGGVDLIIGSKGVNIKNGETDYYAKNGLLMPNNC